MWAKDNYQEQMLGYLDWMQTEIEQLEQECLQRNDLDELYDDLEIVLKCLWRLIESDEVDWELLRYPLEAGCDVLFRTFYRIPFTYTATLPVGFAITETLETKYHRWEQSEMAG